MTTIRLVPSTYAVSNTSYLSVSNASNMYTNTDSTTYATITNTNASTSSRYLYLRGFNFNSVPSNAIVNSFTVKIKGYESGLSTSTSYAPRLADNTSAISGTTASSNFGTSTKTITIPTGSLTWEDITDYGSNFTITVYVRRSNKNTTGYFYCYGAEIEVNYTIPVYHTVTSSTTSGTISPSGATSVLEGDDYTLTINVDNPTVLDNNVDVTSQLQQMTSGSTTLIPNNYTNSNFTVSNITNAYTDASSTTYAQLSCSGGKTGTIYLDLEDFSLPSGSVLESVTCQATLQYSRNGSSSGFTASCQLYSGSSAKGSATTVVSSGGSDVSKTTFNLTVGTWTSNELNNARFYLTATNSARSTVRYIYIYGVSFEITYSISGVVYTYTITNVVGDHTIVVSAGSSATIYIKQNGTWHAYTKGYKKINGSWVEQDLDTLFNASTNYLSG